MGTRDAIVGLSRAHGAGRRESLIDARLRHGRDGFHRPGACAAPAARRPHYRRVGASQDRARALLGADVEIVTGALGGPPAVEALRRSEGIVNLAGEPIVGKRWTAARRARLEQSRVGLTEQLVDAMAAAGMRRGVLVSGSAVGYYGDRGDESLTESSAHGDDFLARLCIRWESAARKAENLGARVVLLRTGVVLGRAGGALAQMLPPFRVGAGGPIGSGRQYFPWIHLHDLVAIIAAALTDSSYRGPVNGVAPEQATARGFARALGHALNRPAVLPVPAIALKADLRRGGHRAAGQPACRASRADGARVRLGVPDARCGARRRPARPRRDHRSPGRGTTAGTSSARRPSSTRRSIRRSRSSRRPRTSGC